MLPFLQFFNQQLFPKEDSLSLTHSHSEIFDEEWHDIPIFNLKLWNAMHPMFLIYSIVIMLFLYLALCISVIFGSADSLLLGIMGLMEYLN